MRDRRLAQWSCFVNIPGCTTRSVCVTGVPCTERYDRPAWPSPARMGRKAQAKTRQKQANERMNERRDGWMNFHVTYLKVLSYPALGLPLCCTIFSSISLSPAWHDCADSANQPNNASDTLQLCISKVVAELMSVQHSAVSLSI